jgi:hypothetical protein
MAAEAVLNEPLSRPIPCYQGLMQGFLLGFAENIPGIIRQSSLIQVISRAFSLD